MAQSWVTGLSASVKKHESNVFAPPLQLFLTSMASYKSQIFAFPPRRRDLDEICCRSETCQEIPSQSHDRFVIVSGIGDREPATGSESWACSLGQESGYHHEGSNHKKWEGPHHAVKPNNFRHSGESNSKRRRELY